MTVRQELFVASYGDFSNEGSVKLSNHLWTELPVINLYNGAILSKLKGFPCCIGRHCLSPVGGCGSSFVRGMLGSNGRDGGASLWSWQKEQQTQKMFFPIKVSALEASCCGKYLAAGTLDGSIIVYDLASGYILRELEGNSLHFGSVTVIRWLYDNSGFLTGGADGRVHLHALSELFHIPSNRLVKASVIDIYSNGSSLKYKPIRSWHEHRDTVTDLCVGLGGISQTRIFSSSIDRTVKIFEPQFTVSIATLLYKTPIYSLRVNLVETQIFAGGDDGLVFAVDLYSFSSSKQPSSKLPVSRISTLSGRHKVAVEDSEYCIKSWSTFESGKVTSLALNFDGTRLVCGSDFGQIAVLHAQTGQLVRKVNAPVGNSLGTGGEKEYMAVTNIVVFQRPPEMDSTRKTLKYPPLQVAPFKSKSSRNLLNIAKPSDLPPRAGATVGSTVSLGANSVASAQLDRFYSSIYLDEPFSGLCRTNVNDTPKPDELHGELTADGTLYAGEYPVVSQALLWQEQGREPLFREGPTSALAATSNAVADNSQLYETQRIYSEKFNEYKSLTEKLYQATVAALGSDISSRT